MTATAGRLEATITVPVGGWTVSVTTTAPAGPAVATIAAGDYYVSALLDAFDVALTAAVGGSWTVVQSTLETTGNGKTVITLATHTFSLTWTSTDLRDALGYTANLGPGLGAYTSTNHAIGLWLPDCPKWTPYGDAVFDEMTDLRQTIGPSGGVKDLQGNSYDALEGLRWDMVSNARAIGKDTVGSWQHFWSTIKTGRYSYIRAGKPCKLFWDSSSTTPANEVKLIAPNASLPPVVDGWTGLYKVAIPMLVKVA